MKHRILGPNDYRRMPWANGKGQTTEILRRDGPDGALHWRLSMAQVVEDGAFSHFAGIERSLTVIKGPAFDLVGEGLRLRAAPLKPVAFAGDVPIAAHHVTAPVVDFNVMVSRHSGSFHVQVLAAEERADMQGKTVAVFATGAAQVEIEGRPFQLGRHALWVGGAVKNVVNKGSSEVIVIGLPV